MLFGRQVFANDRLASCDPAVGRAAYEGGSLRTFIVEKAHLPAQGDG